MKNIILKTIIAAFILSILYFIADLIHGNTVQLNVIFWGFVSNLLIAAVLAFYITNSTLRGFKLALVVFGIYYLIGFFNILIEAYIFNVTDRPATINTLLTGLVVALVYSPALIFLFGKWDGEAECINFKKRTIGSWIWRIAVSDILYLFFYLLAGFILQATYPPLMDFYEGKIPPFDLMINTQFFRALIFILVALIILKTIDIPVLKKALFTGILFTVLGGIAPLIPPNEHMPLYIRWAHGFEVAISNFLFGFVISRLLAQQTIKGPEKTKI